MGMALAIATKVDSNLTGLRYAHETSIGVLVGDGTDVWYQLDPNSYNGFGAQMTLTERTPINPARMRRKGVITDLMADAGFQMDLTKSNARDLLPGFFFAAWQDKLTLIPSATTSAHYAVPSGGAGFVGGAAGSRADLIFAANWANAANNGLKRVTASSGTTVDAAGLAAETSPVTPGAVPYIRRVGVEAATGDLFITETASAITALGAEVVAPGGAFGAQYAPGDVLTTVGGTGTQPTFTVDQTRVSAADLTGHFSALSAVATAPGGSIANPYAPADVLTPTGDTGTEPTFTVTNTEVVALAINNAGTGGTPGAATITGTTGTGTKFQAAVTIGVGGDITSIDSITVAGNYTVNPTLTAEPVTGGSLSGATVDVGTGVLTASLTTPGSVTVKGTNPHATTVAPAGGTGATLTITWSAGTSGGTVGEPDGSGYIVQGTTGTGTRFEASVTVSGGTIVSVDSVSSPGHYTVNPTDLTSEPVTGLGFVVVGAALNLTMGADAVSATTPGAMTAEPPDPTTTSSSGDGTGATLQVSWSPSLPLDLDGAEAVGITMSLRSTALDFTTFNLQPGEWIFVGGDASATQFAEDNDNGFARIQTIATHTIVVDKTANDWHPDAGTGKTVRLFFGSFLSNQVLPANIVRSTVQFERTLSTGGIEYVVGCVPDMFTITMNAASKVTCELKYVGIQTDLLEPGVAAKTGFRPNLPVSQAYNTSSDFGRLALHDRTAGSSLANFMKDATLVINNGAQPVKALSRLGAIDVVVGDFQVTGAITAYFTDVQTVDAVKQNDDVTLDFALIHGNSGLLFDIPLLAVGGGRLNVVKDQPIEIPVTHSGAWDPDLDWVLSCTCYDYLPDLAQ